MHLPLEKQKPCISVLSHWEGRAYRLHNSNMLDNIAVLFVRSRSCRTKMNVSPPSSHAHCTLHSANCFLGGGCRQCCRATQEVGSGGGSLAQNRPQGILHGRQVCSDVFRTRGGRLSLQRSRPNGTSHTLDQLLGEISQIKKLGTLTLLFRTIPKLFIQLMPMSTYLMRQFPICIFKPAFLENKL